MSFTIRTAWPQDLDRLVALAVECQADPQRFSAYLGDDAHSIGTDVADVEGWHMITHVALDDERNVLGWLLAENDPEMGRVWWWGPFLASGESGDAVADILFRAGGRAMAGFDQHELAADARSTMAARLAARHGLLAAESSVVLRCDHLDVSPIGAGTGAGAGVDDVAGTGDADGGGIEVRDVSDENAAAVAALHDRVFPNTHTTGSALVAAADGRCTRLVAIRDDVVVGYVAAELQADGSLYVEYLGVEPTERGRGIGRLLISRAMQRGGAADAPYAHLNVRVPNVAARALYASLGFVEERVVTPYRRGFSLP
jgi:ribosomal protein S18 acetylase RimI-like enzyme